MSLLKLLLLLPLLLVLVLIQLVSRVLGLFLSEHRAGGIQVASGVRAPVLSKLGRCTRCQRKRRCSAVSVYFKLA